MRTFEHINIAGGPDNVDRRLRYLYATKSGYRTEAIITEKVPGTSIHRYTIFYSYLETVPSETSKES